MSLTVETEELLRRTVRTVLDRDAPAGVTAALADLGWDEVVAEDDAAATRVLFSEQGRCLVTSAALDGVWLRAAGCTGARRVGYPVAGADPVRWGGAGRLERVLLLAPVPDGEPVLVPVTGDGAPALAVLEVPAAAQRPLDGLDPAAGWVTVEGTVREVDRPATGGAAEQALARATAAARLALAGEILGAAAGALEPAVAHVSARHQFGRPLSAFQAVRHRLAEAHSRLAGAEALLAAAAAAPTPFGAAAAKACAAAAHAEVLAHAGQVHGAIGLTWEHPLHRFLRRGLLLDGLLGSADALGVELGRAAVATGGAVPRSPLPGTGPDHDTTRGDR